MSLAHVEAIARAVLYEGYILYPYRPSNVKNRYRWTFGGVYPRDYAVHDESCSSSMQTECLVRGSPRTEIDVHVRFLHLVRRDVGALETPVMGLPADREPATTKVSSLRLGEKLFQAWDEAVERDVAVSALAMNWLTRSPVHVPFSFASHRTVEPLWGDDHLVRGILVRESASVSGKVIVAAREVAPAVFRLMVRINNLTPVEPSGGDARSEAQRRTFASTHTILSVRDGAFISLFDPPDDLKDVAHACKNIGTWPVLVGEVGATDTVLSSPIILYDYPEVAPESPGDLFDATEIDEILTLRILAMTDDEKREAAAADERTRALLERTEALTEAEMTRLHGALRNPRFGTAGSGRAAPGFKPELAFLHAGGRDLKVGDRVRLRPKQGADIMDLMLKDEVAVIESIERDFDDKVHVAVVVESDPGRDLGLDRMPGHRFFFSPEEIEPIGQGGEA